MGWYARRRRGGAPRHLQAAVKRSLRHAVAEGAKVVTNDEAYR